MSSDRTRIQFDVLPAELARYDRLVTRCGFQTRAELFRAVVTAFERMTDWEGEGWVVEARRGDEVERLVPLVSVGQPENPDA